MIMDDVSPKYLMQLIPKVDKELWAMFDASKHQNVRRYILKWHKEWYDFNEDQENFHIFYKDSSNKEIDLLETLHNMDPEIVLKIAVDLGIDTPDLLPAVSTIKNAIKSENKNAYHDFDKAIKKVYDEPDVSVAHASSALDGIIKTILEDKAFAGDTLTKNAALSKQVGQILKKLDFDNEKAPQEIITLSKNLRSLGSTIDDIRSDKTSVHGKRHNDYKVDDPLWASFIVNICATLGLFLWEYYEKKYKPAKQEQVEDVDDKPIDLSEIPF